MVTIDGVTCYLNEIEFIHTGRTFMAGAASGDSNLVTQSGYRGLQFNITGYASSVADYDAIMTAFMSPGAHTFIIRTGWQYTVYFERQNMRLTEGFTDNYFPFTVRMICTDPYQYSTAQTTRTKTITATDLSFSQDDSSNDIDTDGTVAAKPDIRIVAAGSDTAALLRQDNKFT